ncbi:hypothetical protein L6452_47049 [Arctium lappa]|nr:hypothetical protein L6452_47049 [Arctium lappa]
MLLLGLRMAPYEKSKFLGSGGIAPEAIRPRARLPGRHASRRPRPRLPSGDACRLGRRLVLPCPWCGWPKKESPLTDARLVVVVKAFVSSRADAREALSNDPNVSSCNDASTATPADGGRRCVPVGCGTARAGPPIDSGRGPVRIGAAAKARAVICPWRCVASIVVGSTRRHGVPRLLRAPGTGLRAPHSARS